MNPKIALSTMWAQQDRFADLAYFRRVVAGFGYEGIEVSHSTGEARLQSIESRKIDRCCCARKIGVSGRIDCHGIGWFATASAKV